MLKKHIWADKKTKSQLEIVSSWLQSVEKPIFTIFFAAVSRIFVFPATCAAEKLLISENRYKGGFQGHVRGIGGSGVQFENFLILGERHSRQDSVDFVDTIKLAFFILFFS